MTTEAATFAWDGGTVSAIWHHPTRGATYLALAHGAGGTMHTPALKLYAESLAARDVGVVRFNFGYSEARRKAPDRQEQLEACYRAIANQIAVRTETLYLGGRSMGGRIASHIVSAGFPAAGLVFLAYPLHPPGKPERIRDAHLYAISVPMLFLQGSRDAFAQPDLLRKTLERLPTATLHVLENGDHGHKVPGRTPADVNAELVTATLDWMARAP